METSKDSPQRAMVPVAPASCMGSIFASKVSVSTVTSSHCFFLYEFVAKFAQGWFSKLI